MPFGADVVKVSNAAVDDDKRPISDVDSCVICCVTVKLLRLLLQTNIRLNV